MDDLAQRLADEKFLAEAATYFRNRPTDGEDRAYWANVYNAENCERIATTLAAKDVEIAAITAERDRALREKNAKLRNVLAEGRRAIGDHFAPNDCYATGPVTGDAYRDLIECPACSFIAMHDAILASTGDV